MAKFTIRKSGSGTELNGVRPSELMAMAKSGELSPSDELRKEGDIEWHLASTVNGLNFAPSENSKSNEMIDSLQQTIDSLQSTIKDIESRLEKSSKDNLLLQDKLKDLAKSYSEKNNSNVPEGERADTEIIEEENVNEVTDEFNINQESENDLVIEDSVGDIELESSAQAQIVEQDHVEEQESEEVSKLEDGISFKDKAKTILNHDKTESLICSLKEYSSWILSQLKTKRGIAVASILFLVLGATFYFSIQKTELEQKISAIDYASIQAIDAAEEGDVEVFLASIGRLADLIIYVSENSDQLANDLESMSNDEIIELSSTHVANLISNVSAALQSGSALYEKMNPEQQAEINRIYSNEKVSESIQFGLIMNPAVRALNDTAEYARGLVKNVVTASLSPSLPFIFYLVTFLNILLGLAILRFGLVKFSLTLGLSVLWTFVLCACLQEYVIGFGGGEYSLAAGVVFGILTFVFAKPFTYIMGFLLAFDIVAVPIMLISSSIFGHNGGIACFAIILGIVAGVYVVKKYRDQMRTFVIAYFGGGTFGLSLGFLLFALIWPSKPMGYLIILFGPYLLGSIGALYMLYARPPWSEKIILFPNDNVTAQQQGNCKDSDI